MALPAGSACSATITITARETRVALVWVLFYFDACLCETWHRFWKVLQKKAALLSCLSRISITFQSNSPPPPPTPTPESDAKLLVHDVPVPTASCVYTFHAFTRVMRRISGRPYMISAPWVILDFSWIRWLHGFLQAALPSQIQLSAGMEDSLQSGIWLGLLRHLRPGGCFTTILMLSA